MQWPMCLVYQPESHKVLSVSRKKIVCHEGIYANFDPTQAQTPIAPPKEVDVTHTQKSQHYDEDEQQIEGVHSIKVLRDAKRNQSMNEALPSSPPSFIPDLPSQPENHGRISTNLTAI
jgi:hypothetical protein